MFTRIFSEGQIGKYLKKCAKIDVIIALIYAAVILLAAIIASIAYIMDVEYELAESGILNWYLSMYYTSAGTLETSAASFFWFGIGRSIAVILIGFVSAIFLYAFGTLVDSSAEQQRLLENQRILLGQIAQSTSAAPAGGSQPAKDDALPPL